MPFVIRSTETPDLATILQLEQIVIVDKTGPAITVGISAGLTMLVGEFLQGGFDPAEVTSGGEIASTYGVLSAILSQNIIGAAAVQDGSGGAFDGNGLLQLKSKSFRRLGITRVDTEAVTTDGGSTKGVATITVTINAAEQAAGVTTKDITLSAGTRFGDTTLSLAAIVVALSQPVLIPKGSTVTANQVVVTANVFFVKAITAAIAAVDTVIDSTIPNSLSVISIVNNTTALFAPGTGGTLKARIITRYLLAIAKTVPAQAPSNDITAIWSARRGTVIRQALRDNAVLESTNGRGRVCCVAAEPAEGDTAADATAARNAALAINSGESLQVDRVFTSFPYVQVFSAELGSVNVLVSPDGFKAMMCSQLAPEIQTGVANQFMNLAIQNVEPAFITQPLGYQDYVNLKAAGISAINKDVTVGWWFYSSVTAVNPVAFPTRVFDNRRRFADFVQDTLSNICAPYIKQPGTTERIDAITSEIDAFLTTLQSPQDPSQSRIEAYSVDSVSGNTPQLRALGIFTIIIVVQMFGDLNQIVLQTVIGPTAIVVQQAA